MLEKMWAALILTAPPKTPSARDAFALMLLDCRELESEMKTMAGTNYKS